MISLEQVKKIAEEKIRNASFLFDLPKLEEAIKKLRDARQLTEEEVIVSENDVTYAWASPVMISLFPDFEFLSPLEQVATLIHETIHSYLDIKHAHDDLFLSLFRNVMKTNYKHILVGRHHYFSVGGFRYITQFQNIKPPFTIVCPKCKTPQTMREDGDLECYDCGFDFS